MKSYIQKNRKVIALTLIAALVLVVFSGCASSAASTELHDPVRQLSWFGKLFVAVDQGLNIHNFGWTIIILTLMMRIIILPLDIKQKMSMRKQAALQPKIDAINQKYKNDKEKASKKTMELYKEEGVSMFAGCLPALIQLPLFFAFFAALRNVAGVEIFDMYTAGAGAHVQSWLWVNNIWQPDSFWAEVIPAFSTLSQYDIFKNTTLTADVYNAAVAPLVAQFEGIKNGFFLLPLLAAGSSYLMNRITMPPQPKKTDANAAPNPMNSKIMQFMFPLMSLWVCSSSNAVFAIYWLASNIIGIVSFLIIDKILTRRDAKKAAAALEKQEGGTP
ncbi:MAG: YidC/Oxa1 family membrane protein insertase [Eubacteriales bacterium]|nr:YidC/Oxa1 family membrane protein insertase [Eubacteriales bacterium]